MRWPNDWSMRKCLYLCGSITVIQIILTALSGAGIEVPVLHQIVGFVFVTFVPGILLLRIFRIHNINKIESIAYSAGLSLALVMFSGAAINFIFPLFKISQPITLWPVMLTLVAETAILAIAAWAREKDFESPPITKLKLLPNINAVLFLVIILLLIIFGVQISDMTGNNLILIISLLLIAAVVCLAAFNKFITPDVYPFALFIIGLGLLYQTTLMSPYLVGSDIYTEYSFFREAASGGVWNSTLANPVNSCLSIVILGPVYSLMTGIDGIWVFKTIYPLLFALMPLILFRIFRPQIGARPSFFAVFFFMIVPTFSLELVSLCRQQVAEIFLALTVLLLVERKLPIAQKLIMLIIFSFSIAVSHYSLGFITIAYLVMAIPLLAIIRSKLFLNIWGKMTSRTGGLPDNIRRTLENTVPLKFLIIPVVLYVVFLLAWYSLVGSGINLIFISSVLNFQVNAIGDGIGNGINLQLGNSPGLIKTAVGLDFFEVTWQGKLFRLFQYLTQLLIIIGCLRLLISPRGLKLKGAYIILSVISVGLLAACFVIPGFAGILNATRWYHISLIILAPFCVIGAETLWILLLQLKTKFKSSNIYATSEKYLLYLAILVLVPYYILTSGIVYECTGQTAMDRIESPYSIALSSHRLDITGIFSRQDAASALWISRNGTSGRNVYCDNHSNKIFTVFSPACNIIIMPRDETLPDESYVYLTSWNMEKQQLTFAAPGKPGLREYVAYDDITGLMQATRTGNCIYTNGSSEILFKP